MTVKRTTRWALAAATLMLGLPCSAQAGPVMDWLCGRRGRDEVVVGYVCCDPCNPCNPCVPTVTCEPACPPLATAAVQPTPVPVQPATEFGVAPIMQTPAPVRVPAPRAVPRINPIPQTYYRTVWRQVPVTSYRPLVTSDPVTGHPVTVMRPCTTYTWQAERRREGFFRRMLNRLCRPRRPVATAPSAVYCAPVCVPSAIECSPAAPSSTMTPVPAPMHAGTPAPYYQGSPAPQQIPSPPTTVPGTDLGSPLPSRPPASPPGAAPAPPGAEPADQRPRLTPDEVPEARSAASPQSGALVEIPSTDGARATGANASRTTSPDQPASPKIRNLKPVPDPDAPAEQPDFNAPQLLNPRDRVAAHPRLPAGARSMIVWPAAARSSGAATRPANTARQPAKEAGGPWDDSGWHSLNP